jgi:PAS domain S-box-containing protein
VASARSKANIASTEEIMPPDNVVNQNGGSRYDSLILSEAPDATLIINRQGEILHWSSGAELVFGYSRAETIGRRMIDLVCPTDRIGEVERMLAETLQSGSATFEALRQRKTARWSMWTSQARPSVARIAMTR